ncbi:hypothetical protein LN893_17880 [Pontibacter sp. XAAS-A31]|nr:hypothetical protein [Pontibacter harenae]
MLLCYACTKKIYRTEKGGRTTPTLTYGLNILSSVGAQFYFIALLSVEQFLPFQHIMYFYDNPEGGVFAAVFYLELPTVGRGNTYCL